MSQAKLVRCPAPGHGQGNGDRNPSLLVSREDGGRLRVHCFAGCAARDVLDAMGGRARTITNEPDGFTPNENTSDRALKLWSAGRPICGTPAERYLRARGLRVSPAQAFPALRYLHHAWHPQATEGVPALIAGLSDDAGIVTAVQRLYLTRDGAKANLTPVRMARGRMGRSAVRLGPAAATLGLAEGVETALAASQMFKVPVWAVCGTRFHRIAIPPDVCRVVIFADNDAPGIEAARRAHRSLRSDGRIVDVHIPDSAGHDWADAAATQTAGSVSHA